MGGRACARGRLVDGKSAERSTTRRPVLKRCKCLIFRGFLSDIAGVYDMCAHSSSSFRVIAGRLGSESWLFFAAPTLGAATSPARACTAQHGGFLTSTTSKTSEVRCSLRRPSRSTCRTGPTRRSTKTTTSKCSARSTRCPPDSSAAECECAPTARWCAYISEASSSRRIPESSLASARQTRKTTHAARRNTRCAAWTVSSRRPRSSVPTWPHSPSGFSMVRCPGVTCGKRTSSSGSARSTAPNA
jgi:hypothetical protein